MHLCYRIRNSPVNESNGDDCDKEEDSGNEEPSLTRSSSTFSLECCLPDVSNESFHEHDASQPHKSESPNEYKSYITIACIILIALFGILIYKSKEVGVAPHFDCPQFKELTKRFTGQDTNLWKSLKIGIESVLNNKPTTPSIFLLAYYDINTAHRVMKEVLAATADCMNSSNPIQLDGSTFATNEMIADYGIIINQYRDRLQHDGIMFVSDLNQVPAEAAQVFHTICDTITPLVDRAVIFFTVYVHESDKALSSRRVSELVETELEKNWNRNNKVSVDTLKALIGRVTDQVLLLKTEN